MNKQDNHDWTKKLVADINDDHARRMREFETGATRSDNSVKINPEGFLSPLVIDRYCQYMNKHRVQEDGQIRSADNWQKGIPLPAYMESLWRHFLDLWHLHRGYPRGSVDRQEACCAVLFNVMGYLHELLEERDRPDETA